MCAGLAPTSLILVARIRRIVSIDHEVLTEVRIGAADVRSW
jgi:hypothetical protein